MELAASHINVSKDDNGKNRLDAPGEEQSWDSRSLNYDTFQNGRRCQSTDGFKKDIINFCSDDDDGVFTIQEAVDRMEFGAFQIKITCLLGLANMAEAMEVMLLPVLSSTLKCIFHLDSVQQSVLSMVVFLGIAVSASFWGKLGDVYGRKTSVVMSAILYSYFGVLTSFSPVFSWIVVSRFLVALGMGGNLQVMTLYSEFIPTTTRSRAMLFVEVVWAVGASLEVLLAMVTLSYLTWRWLLFFTACPTIAFILLHKFVPESPRYLLSHGRPQEALDILKDIARANGKELPRGRLCEPSHAGNVKNGIRDLFSPKFLRTTLLVALAMSTSFMAYYGTALLTTSLMAMNDGCHGYNSKTTPQSSCWSLCKTLSPNDYLDLFVTSLGDLPGILVCSVLMHKLGRLPSLYGQMLVYTAAMLLCNLCLPRNVLVVFLFCARAMTSGTSQGIVVYITEVFPTPIRAIGMGFSSSVRSCGIILAVCMSTILVDCSAFLGITSFAAIGFIGALAFFFLPYETKNKSMAETLDESFI